MAKRYIEKPNGRRGLILGLVLLLCLGTVGVAGCTKQNNNAPQATVMIESIVDKATHQPITDNTVTFRWETATGKVITTEKYEDQSNLSTTLLADGRTRLWVTVEAPGYKTWENAIRLKLNADKPLRITVEMERANPSGFG